MRRYLEKPLSWIHNWAGDQESNDFKVMRNHLGKTVFVSHVYKFVGKIGKVLDGLFGIKLADSTRNVEDYQKLIKYVDAKNIAVSVRQAR